MTSGRIIPAPSGWSFHVMTDWELNRGAPVHEVHPVFAFEMKDDKDGRPQVAVGVYFLDTYSHQLSYTDESSPYRAAIGMFGPGQTPDPDDVEAVRSLVAMTARQARAEEAAVAPTS